MGNSPGIDGKQQRVGTFYAPTLDDLLIEVFEHRLILAYLLRNIIIGAIDIESCADGAIHKVNDVKGTGVLV